MLIDRHSNFREWGRLLNESVRCYGTALKESDIRIFFHGISAKMLFSDTFTKFFGPTSTTTAYHSDQLCREWIDFN